MRNKMVAMAGAVALAAGLAGQVQANEGAYVGGSVTGYQLDSTRFVGGAEQSAVGGVNLGYRFSNDWALEAGLGRDFAGERLDVGKLDMYYWFGDANPDSTAWRPYWVAGISYFDLDKQDAGKGLSYLHEGKDEHSWSVGAGLGLSKMISDHFEFRGDVRGLYKVRDNENKAVDGALNLAVNYYFNGPKAAPVTQAAAEPAPAVKAVVAPPPAAPPEKRTITVKLNVLFDFNKADVRAIYGDELQAVANAMKAHDDIELVLEGHTDSVGSDAYNQSLSLRRVNAVKDKLAKDYGIPGNRISTVGYGESRPIADNATAEGRQRNRRVIGELSYTEVMPK
jgi:OOP family OmpA-OmpF porin